MWRERLWLVLLAVLTMLGTLSAVEIGLRLFWKSDRLERDLVANFVRDDSAVGRLHVANATIEVPFAEHPKGKIVLRTNNLGLREDVDTEEEKASAVVRILVLGDSHTDGAVYNEESYANRLERLLAARDGRRTEVLNAAVGTYHPLLELLWLRKFGPRLRPDVIVIAAYSGNDIGDLLTCPHLQLCEEHAGCGMLMPRPTEVERLKRWLRRSLAIFHLLSRGIHASGIANWLHALGLMAAEYVPTLGRAQELCQECLWQDLYQSYLAREHPAAMRMATESTRRIFEEISEEAQHLGAQLVMLVLPTRRQVEPEEDVARIDEVVEVLGLTPEEARFSDTIRQNLLEFAEQLEIPALDVLPLLRSSYLTTRRSLYWRTDWHLNVEGHRLVAGALHAFLAQNLFGQRTGTNY